MHNPSFSSNIVFGIFTAEGRYNLYTTDGKYIFKERESFDGRNILKVSMKQSELETFGMCPKIREDNKWFSF